MKWHNSSIPRWNILVNDQGDPDRGLITGIPRSIRSDEWLIHSSFVVAQYKKGFPVENEALGYGKIPLLFRLPVYDILSEIKPALWGYYFLDIERAFSWEWNFKIFPFLMVSFLFLLLLTGNNFTISLFGSLWLLLSTSVQWWSMNTEVFSYGCCSLISFIYILLSEKTKSIVANGLIFILSAYSFVMVIYPAYQVPLAYLLLAILAGIFFKYRKNLKVQLSKKASLKVFVVGLSVAILSGLIILFYHSLHDTIQVASHTLYPGKRNEKGGDFSFIRLFTDNFKLYMDTDHVPRGWINICEAASFLMVSPVVLCLIIYNRLRKIKVDPLVISLIVFQVLICLWLCIGFPAIISRITLLNASPPGRTFYILGFSNVITTLVFLSGYRKAGTGNSILAKCGVFVLILLVVSGINILLNREASYFFSWGGIWISTVIISCLYWTVVYFNDSKLISGAFFIICLGYLLPNLKINPLSMGLSPFLENKIYTTLSDVNDRDPDSRWVVFGESTLANYLKAAGINCLNGVQYLPPLAQLHVLDPYLKNEIVYNRYAHIGFNSVFKGDDEVDFSLIQKDFYKISMNPCSPRLETLGIKYFLFTYVPDPIEVQCMSLVKNAAGIAIYKRN